MKHLTFLLVSGFIVSLSQAAIVTLPHPDEKLPAESTVVWSPLFQATWDTMNRNLGGPPERVEPPNPLMAKLDATKWKPKAVMPEGSWKTWGGSGTQAFLDQVNREAMELTGDKKGPFALPENLPHDSIVCYGILDRKVEFVKPFYRAKKTPMDFKFGKEAMPVRYFGAPAELVDEFRESVRILSWRPSERSHAIQVTCKQQGESLVLYLPGKAQDFSTACRWLHKWRTEDMPVATFTLHGATNDPFPHENDLIQIPYVALDVREGFVNRLRGLRYHAGHKNPMKITAAEQHTRFKLDEKGADVRVEAMVAAPFGADPDAPVRIPRHFIYDRPFFALLWRDGAEWPYFGVWLGDDTALEKVR